MYRCLASAINDEEIPNTYGPGALNGASFKWGLILSLTSLVGVFGVGFLLRKK